MTSISFDQLLPEGVALKPFQTVGVAYASVTRRTFIADEMGLGKTIQALVALEANNAYPAVVACPASLKGNWANEVRRFLPGRSVEVVSGKRPYPVTADVVIVNYDVLSAWKDALAQPVALVLDESHYAKTPGAARTKAAQELADSVPAEGVVLCLTGTAYQNRPIELISQLQILGQLDKIVAGEYQADEDPVFAFKWAFCRNEDSKAETGKYTWDGAINLDKLNDRLRGTCLVRRERAEVLGLTDTVRVPVTLSLNGALKAYRAAEADILGFLKVQAETRRLVEALAKGEDDAEAKAQLAGLRAKQAAQAAEALVKLGQLRKLAGEAKVEATAEWVENFLTSNPDKSIVIFAWHKEVQAKLVEALAAYEPAQILGGQTDVEAQKARFQAKETRVIVCSIKAASEGHTLTAASDVLFVEQPWHAGAEQQAEDRVNRIGRTAEAVFAWKLLAEDTIDGDIARLIEKKRAVFRAGIIGEDVEDEGSVASEILDSLRRRAEEA
jgi:SWI/SNF-related matrix-associated actin-dependent regulator 1 of chromatin subfamily A